MSSGDLHFHYVCTPIEAKKLVEQQERFWVMNCGCRENRGKCERSRMDVCLLFREEITGSGGSGKKEISKTELDQIFLEAKEKHLVTRPFRNDKDRTVTEGICFCCDDCCGYFLDPTEICDKGISIEKTDWDKCTHYGICTDVCYFNARKMNEEKLVVDRNNCYGCGLCLEVCPEDCIGMASRR